MSYVKTLLKIFPYIMGLFPEPTVISVIFFLNTVLIMGEINAFIYTTKIIHRIEILYQVLCYIFNISTQYVSWNNRKFLLRICHRLGGDSPAFVGQNAAQHTEDNFKKIVNTFAVMYLTTLAVYLAAPWINFFLKEMNYNDPLSYPMPFWFAIFEVNSIGEYFFINFVQCVFCVLSFGGYTFLFGFIICALININAHVKEVQRRTKVLGEKMNIAYGEYLLPNNTVRKIDGFFRNEIYSQRENSLLDEFLEIIKYKQWLERYSSDMAKYFQWIFSAAIAWFVSVCVLTVFMTIQIVSDVSFKIKTMAAITNVTFSFLLFCYVAEVISHINEKCMEYVYDVPWHYNFLKLRKMLLMMLLHSQKVIEIKAFNMYTMNMNLFFRVLRVVYSCLNVLLLAQRK